MNLNTFLHKSAFNILEVSVRDSREKIIDQAENKSLLIDHEICNRAQSALNTSKLRVTEELNWLPGVAPNKAKKYLEELSQGLNPVDENLKLNGLVKANLLAAYLQTLDDSVKDILIIPLIINLSEAVDSIEISEIAKEINADRTLAGYAQINDLEQIENELKDKKIFFTGLVKNFLNELSSKKLVSIVTKIVDESTNNGAGRAPSLVHEIVSRYEDETFQVLTKQIQDINDLINEIKADAKLGEKAITPLYDELEELVESWDVIAQPIQLSTKALGTDHKMSIDLAGSIRSLSVFLLKEHDMLDTTVKINKLLKNVFKEVPQILELAGEDTGALDKIIKDEEQSRLNKKEFESEITYQAEIGLVFQDTLRISPKGVEYKGKHIELDDITSVMWGAIRHSVNGIPTGTDYSIHVSSPKKHIYISTRKKEVYSTFIDKLWRAACVRILFEYYNQLKNGNKITIGEAVIHDDGIVLLHHKFFKKDPVYKKWTEIQYWTSNGALVVADKDNKKVYIELPYISTSNVHILESMMRLSFKTGWTGKLSGYLDAR
jgi:hypothetical protein